MTSDIIEQMKRVILKFRGQGGIPEQDAEEILGMARIRLVDRSPRMMLVELLESDIPILTSIVAKLDSWSVTPEHTFRVPDPRPKPRPTH